MPRRLLAVALGGLAVVLAAALSPASAVPAPARNAPPATATAPIASSAVRTSITGFDPPAALALTQVLRDRVIVTGPVGRPVVLQVKRGRAWVTVATVRTVRDRALRLPVATFAVPMSRLAVAAGYRTRGIAPRTILRIDANVVAPRSGTAAAGASGPRSTRISPRPKTLLGVVPEFVVGNVQVEHWWKGPAGPAPYTGITGSLRFVSNGGTAATNGGARALYKLWTATLPWQSRGYTYDGCVHTGTGQATAGNLISEQPYVVPVTPAGTLPRTTPYSLAWFQNAVYRPNVYFSCPDGILPSTILNALSFRTRVCAATGGLRDPVVARPRQGGTWDMSGALPRTGTPCSTPDAFESYDTAWQFTGVGWKEIYAP